MKKAYLAAGFFNDKQLADVQAVEQVLLSKGISVFSPRLHQFKELEFGSVDWRHATFDNDVAHIREADVMVAIVDEQYDSGTVWEMGYAFCIGVPIILIDVSKNKIANIMLTESVTAYLFNSKELEAYDFDTMQVIPYTGEVI